MTNNQSEAKVTLGRLRQPPSSVQLEHLTRPLLEVEKGMLYAYVNVDLAHTVMLAKQAILSSDQARAILPALQEIERLGSENFPTDPSYGSLLFQVEKFLVDHIGEDSAGRMHTGRSRIDQGTAVNRLYARDQLLEALRILLLLQDSILRLVEEHKETLMPGYTHLQHAQPTTFGHYLLRHYYTFERDQDRLEAAFIRSNLSALGGAAMIGTSWPLDRDLVARLLGHEGLVQNAIDAGDYARDYPAENASVLALLVNNISRLAGDLYLFATWEFGMVEVADELSGLSSMMPQKKNSIVLERIRGIAGLAIGWFPSTLGTLRSVSSSDLDLIFSPDPINEMAKATFSVLEMMRATLDSLHVRKDVMRQRSGVFWSTSSHLADAIVRETGVSFRTAHHSVARLVGNAIAKGILPTEVTGQMLDEAAEEAVGRRLELSDEMVRSSLDPEQVIRSLVTAGSANPQAVETMIEDGLQRQSKHRDWHGEKSDLVQNARVQLEAEIGAIVGAPQAAS